MAIRTVAQAAADIRLSDAKANQDFERIRRQLVQKATRLEADLAIELPVTIDQNALRDIATGLDQLNQDVPPITVPIIADADQVLGEIIGLEGIGEGIVVPVSADVDQALEEIIALNDLDFLIEIPVTANIEAAEGELAGLEQAETVVEIPVVVNTEEALEEIVALTELGLTIPARVIAETERALDEILALTTLSVIVPAMVVVDTGQAIDEILALTTLDPVIRVPVEVERPATPPPVQVPISEFPEGPTTLSLQADVTDARSQIDSFIADLPPVVLRVLTDTDEAVASLNTIDAAAEPLVVPVLADVDTIVPTVEAVDIPPIEVPVTASGVGPGIAVSPGLARFREEMAALEQEGVLVRVLGDTTNAEAKIAALGGGDPPDPIVIPVAADTDQAQADVAAVDATAEPVVIPAVVAVDVGQAQKQLAVLDAVIKPLFIPVLIDPQELITQLGQLSGARLNIHPVVIPTVLGPPPPPRRPPDLPPVVMPLTADVEPAQQQIGAFGAQAERESQGHGERAGSAFGRGFSAAATGVMATAAITLGGVLATSLVEGFQRFTTIQDSVASLTVALESATAATELLDNVLNVVKGTPFRLDDFSRAATNMVSFGIAASKVPLYLTAIGEAAATRGSQANQFAQSLSTIYGQIQAIGRINGEDVWQFGNVGVDVLRILGNTMDKTTEDVRDMISEGAITSDFALDAITQGILHGTEGINGATVAFSGTMEKLGDTLTGSIENFGAARARFGVAIIRPISDTMIAGFKSFTAVLDDFAKRIEPVFEGLAASPLFESINEFFENAPGLIQPTIDALEGLGPALAPIGIAIGALGLGALATVLGPTLGALIPGITSLTGAVTVFGASVALLTPEIRDALIPALKELGEVGIEIGGTLVEGIGEGIEGVAPVVVHALEALTEIGPEIETLFTQAFGAIGELGPKVVPILDHIVVFAQQALPVAFRAASQGIVVLTGIVDAALPIVDQLLAAATDLIPTFEAVLDATAALGEVLIPVLDTVGELLGDLPVPVLQTLLGVFLGFKAIQFINPMMSGLSKNFRDIGQSTGQAVKSIRDVSATAVAAGAAISGAFAGMALASEDSSTRMIGAVSAIGTILTGFALGGAPGGIFAAIGVGIGYMTQGFIDSKKAAEDLERQVTQLANAIESEFNEELVTPEGIINTEAFKKSITEGLGTDVLLSFKQDLGVGFEDIAAAAQTQGELVKRAIEMGMDPHGITFFEDWVSKQITELTRLRSAGEDFEFNVPLGNRIALMNFDNLNGAQFIDSSKRLAKEFGVDQEDVRDQIRATQAVQEEFGEGYIRKLHAISGGIDEVIIGQEALGVVAEETSDDQIRGVENTNAALEEWKQKLLEDGITMEELREQAKALGNEAESAADRASAAWDRFGSVLDAVKQKMDLTVQTQNLDQDMRDLGDTLDKVVNTEDLKKADKIGEDIVGVEKRIADLKVRLADETAQGDIIRADLDRRIAFSAARGFDEVVAHLQAERDLSFEDANKVQRDIDEQIAKIAEMRGELDGLVTTPITMFQVLTQQAADANMTMFEFLLAAPTPEAQAVFQDNLVGTVSDAIAKAATVGEQEGALAGQAAAESFRADFAALLTAEFGPETAAQLIEKLWPQALIQTGAETAASAAVEAFNKQVEADMAAEPGTIDLNAEILDLTQQRDELDTFIKDHPGIEVPITLADFDEAIVDLRLKKIQETIDARIAEVDLANKVELAEGRRRPGVTVADAFASMFPDETELAERSARKLLSDAQHALDQEDPVEMKAEIIEVEKTRDEFQTLIEARDIELPANLNIDEINLVIDEAKKKEVTDSLLDMVPSILGGNVVVPLGEGPAPPGFHWTHHRGQVGLMPDEPPRDARTFGTPSSSTFAEGGIHGFGTMDAPHVAQIAHGYRLWAEPETGGEAYLPLGANKRVSALGVFMKVAEIFDMDVRPRKEVPTLFDVNVPDINVPQIKVPNINVNVPHINVPQMPQIDVPRINVNVPDIKPDINVNVLVNVPEIEAPQINVPDVRTPDINVPDIRIPEIAKMFQVVDARGDNVGTSVRNAMVDAMHAVRRPVTQEDLERNVVVERIEHLVIGPGETSRKRASEFIREMRLRAARL